MVPSSAEDGVVTSDASQWVVFACGEQWFGLPLDVSREILTPRPMTRLPGCGPEVCGLVGIRGRVHTVFDFGIILGGRSALQAPDYRMLVLVVAGRRVAVIVDEIIAVSRDPGEVQPLNDALPHAGHDRDDFVGTCVFGDRSFLALDPDRILGRLLM
jgi:chemotaxis signal transduction protein